MLSSLISSFFSANYAHSILADGIRELDAWGFIPNLNTANIPANHANWDRVLRLWLHGISTNSEDKNVMDVSSDTSTTLYTTSFKGSEGMNNVAFELNGHNEPKFVYNLPEPFWFKVFENVFKYKNLDERIFDVAKLLC